MPTYEKICAVTGKTFTANSSTAKNCPEIRELFDRYPKKFNVVSDLRTTAKQMMDNGIAADQIIEALVNLAPVYEDSSNAKSTEMREYYSLKAISARKAASRAAYQADNRDEEQRDRDEQMTPPVEGSISEAEY